MSKHQRAKKKAVCICILCGLVSSLLTACGGERLTPTPLPADIVRPVQPAPVYGESSNFMLATATPPTGTVVVSAPLSFTEPMTATSSMTLAQTVIMTAARSSSTFVPQPPTALGIATGGTVLQETAGGRALISLPAGTTVTVTGKRADGRYVAAYTEQAIVGWIPSEQLLILGGEELVVVEASSGPGPIATLIAEAMQPVTITQVISSSQ